jgi:Flp pilus assembly protein TadD
MYMTIDARRDHSFRVPRPDLTVTLGTPNACGSCHENRPATWAAQQVRQWFGDRRTSRPHYAEALAAGRSAAADAEPRLLATIDDPEVPPIAKATAVSLLRRWIDPRSGPVLQRAAASSEALVRMAAVDVLTEVPEQERLPVLTPLLADSVRAVRMQAARALATVPAESLADVHRARLKQALAEWEAAQRFNADGAGARVSLGALYAARGETDRARAEYEAALRLEPYFAPASINLADLYRTLERDDEGERVLREALARTPEIAALHRTLGLLLVRRKNLPAALNELHRAAELAPDDVDEQYTYAVALYSAGHPDAGIALLDRTHRAHPGDRTLLTALLSFVRERGDLRRAETFAERLVALSPDDPRAGTLLAEIRQSRRSAGTPAPHPVR